MKRQTLKTIQQILLVIACLAALIGTVISVGDEELAAHDVSKIDVDVVGKECTSHSAGSGDRYEIDLTFQFRNKSKVCWNYLKVTTYVYDGSQSLGSITTVFGKSGTSDLRLDVGETVTRVSNLEADEKDDFVTALCEKDLSELKFESEVTYGEYYVKNK